MSKLKKLSIGYGQVLFKAKIDAVAKTTRVEGNTTINNMGSPEVPANHQVNFYLGATCDADGKEHINGFSLDVVVHGIDPKASYFEIENAAALLLAPLLREIANDVEKQVNKSAEEWAKEK